MKLRDKYGWPVVTVKGKCVLNFFRYLFLTDVIQTIKRSKGGKRK